MSVYPAEGLVWPDSGIPLGRFPDWAERQQRGVKQWICDNLHILWRAAGSGMADDGPYEVTVYESVLELLSRRGERAHFRMRQKIRDLQNQTISLIRFRSPA